MMKRTPFCAAWRIDPLHFAPLRMAPLRMAPLRMALLHTACLLAAVAACLPAHADDAALLRCRAFTEPAARLACYDAVPLAAAARSGAPSAAAAILTKSAPGTTAAGAGAGAFAGPAVAGAGAAAAATAPAPSATEKFGLEAKAAAETERITSSLPGPFEGWGPRQIFKFANGQVWQATEGGSAYYQLRDPKVTVRRAAFGSFMMEIEGVAHILRVRRIQ